MEKPSPEENRTESLEMQSSRELAHEEARVGSSGEQRRSLGSQTASPERQDSDEQPSLADSAPTTPEVPDFLFSCESSSLQNRPTASDTESIASTQSASEDTPPQDKTKELMDYWLQCIKEWFPKHLEQTYFLPSVFFRRVIYDAESVSGQVFLSPQPYGTRRRSSGRNHGQSHQRRLQTNPQNQNEPPSPAGAIFTQPNPRSLPPVDNYLESDRADDDTNERFLKCLQYLSKQGGKEEVMMVISQLEFKKYLQNNTSPIQLAKVHWDSLLRPGNMEEQQYHEGDFDVLIIHRHYGLIVCEQKAVGGDRREVADSSHLNRMVVRRVNKAVEQLTKAKEVLTHLVSDIASVQVTKTLVLPNVTSAELISAVNSTRHLEKDLCDCLEVQDLPTAISRCLCSDKMPYPADLHYLPQGGNSSNQSTTPAGTMDTLLSWWQEIKPDLDPHMSDEVYDCLLARFCGPATMVEVPTVSAIRTSVGKKGKLSQPLKVLRKIGEAVAETGLIFSLLCLYPDHVTILSNNTLRCVHLCGSPGTGKTTVLVLKALQWIRQGRPVYVVSFYEDSRAVSILIESYLRFLLKYNPAPSSSQNPVPPGTQGPGAPGNTMIKRVVIKQPYTKDDVLKLAAMASEQELYIIADEVAGHSRNGERILNTDTEDFERFVDELHDLVPAVSVWCASMQKLSPRLTGQEGWMPEKELTIPLRSPLLVTKEVARSTQILRGNIPAYSIPPVPAATEGHEPIFPNHLVGQGHKRGSALRCGPCGQAVVQILKTLNVGEEQEHGTKPPDYRDVLILATNYVMPGEYSTARPKKGIIGALLREEYPVKVLKRNNYTDADLCEVALALENKITVTNYEIVSGLERMVVIGMGVQADRAALQNRLFGMSRCTSQLVWISTVTDG